MKESIEELCKAKPDPEKKEREKKPNTYSKELPARGDELQGGETDSGKKTKRPQKTSSLHDQNPVVRPPKILARRGKER